MSEAFNNLPNQKKERIINACIDVFASYGYKKASVFDIAKKANISKAMIFTYFGSKLGCYEYICNHMLEVSFYEFNLYKDEILSITDFFDRLIISVKLKVDIFKRYPAMLNFATSLLTEKDPQVSEIINKTFKKGYKMRDVFLNSNIDSSKFKDPNDAQHIQKMAQWLSLGCADEWTKNNQNIDETVETFIKCVQLLKKNFYK